MPTNEFIRELKRKEIIHCATIHFCRKGFDGVSLSEIAADLGVTKAALYNYTTGKRHLLVQCYLAAVDEILSDLHAEWNSPGSGGERLSLFLAAWTRALDQPNRQILWAFSRPLADSTGGREVDAKVSEFCSKIRELLTVGMRDGSIVPDVDLDVAPLLIVGGVSAAFAWIGVNAELDREAMLRRIVEQCTRSYLTQP